MSVPAAEPRIPHTGGPRVLVVDDEVPLARLVAGYLRRDGFEVETVADGEGAIARARAWRPAVIVLDLGLPGVDGTEVCRAVRAFSDCYIVMLTARVDEIDKLVGLSVGADDYLTKPFSPRELVARVRAMLRRPRLDAAEAAPELPISRFGELSVDVVGREVRVAGAPVSLTKTEFDILAALAARPGMVFTRGQLIEAVWGGVWLGDEHLVDVHIGHVRRKLGDDPAAPVFIRTVRGVGYRMGLGR
ncbi:response regulator transcription factor [Pengzhenrongella sicca]|uniref:Response regulator transcription factor n=1 Tax=Pengzhenrongella sicca TaxID=2819238 RepID=A0A8A4Z9G3_9MICO|nr:response regulator transcription factor [Pengzhenrongella sicca]QTE28115.1 response regulator transcription factor [Pengzhenrongella sicca]